MFSEGYCSLLKLGCSLTLLCTLRSHAPPLVRRSAKGAPDQAASEGSTSASSMSSVRCPCDANPLSA